MFYFNTEERRKVFNKPLDVKCYGRTHDEVREIEILYNYLIKMKSGEINVDDKKEISDVICDIKKRN